MSIKQLFQVSFLYCPVCTIETEHVWIIDKPVCLDHAEEDEESIKIHNKVIMERVLQQL